MSTLAVSSFSLHSQLGPLVVDVRQEDGSLKRTEYAFPRKYSLEEFAALVPERTGARAVELCQIQFDAYTPERVQEIKAGLDKAGVSVLTVPIDHGNLAQLNEEWRREDADRTVEWFRVAAELGAKYVRVNAGSSSTYVPEARPGLVETLRRLGDAAGELEMSLLIENHGGISSDPEFLLQLREDVGTDRLGFLLDVGNFEPLVSFSHKRFAGEEADDAGLDLEPLYSSIAAIAPHASLIHAKAVDPGSNGRPLPDLRRALSIAADAGYIGSVSVEWEGRLGDPWEQTASIVSQVREVFPQLT